MSKPMLSVAAFLALLTVPLIAQGQVIEQQLERVESAQQALAKHDYQSALSHARSLAENPANNRIRLTTADLLLRCGQSKQAVKLFDRYLVDSPQAKPYLWQRGIALYFASDFDAGAKQFEVHRDVNPNDVENAAWHFLCVAKRDSPEHAKQLLLPAPNDPREPMEQVLEMFRSGDTDAVSKRMESIENERLARSAKFYGNFYLGLYADAMGNSKTAQKHLDAAAKDAPANYMGDVARVYAKFLRSQDSER